MKLKNSLFFLFILLLIQSPSYAQRGKDSGYTTVSSGGTVVNTYVKVPGNVSAGATTITVSNIANLTGGAFTGALAAGDLIMIIQMQGASIDIDHTPSSDPSWGSQYTVPSAYLWSFDWYNHAEEWGQVTNYNNCGKFEQVEVRSVAGNVITLQCALQNSYTATGNVQVVRIPRFQDLTINSGATLVPAIWSYTNGTGGVVAIEVNGNLVIQNTGIITATGFGFAGAIADNTGSSGSTTPSSPAGVGSSFLGSNSSAQGGRHGESIAGYTNEYSANYSIYGRGSAGNGGGGGGMQNSGGGGGSNVGTGTYTGKGVPNPTYNTSWNLENAGFAGSSSAGGGRGGYSYSTSDQNELTVGPNIASWSGDTRKINGGLGGHALTYDATRIFMGGGGGAGDQDSGQGGSGGNGGGIVMVTCYGTISGAGSITANGSNGTQTNPLNQTPPPGTSQKRGNDGAGGAGGGGSILIRNSNPLPATITLNANGGNGGNVNLVLSTFAQPEGNGPGGGGAGGVIRVTSGSAVTTVNGGVAGTTNSAHFNNMPVNGATNGASGLTQSSTIYNIIPNNITVCQGQPITLTASFTGTAPGTMQWYSGPFTSPVLGSGTSFTPSPAPTTTTTYYVSVCPGTFRVPVTVTVNPAPIISGTALIADAGCTTPGGITGLSASGGTGTLDFTWNGASSPSTTLSNASTGSYTLVVTDDNGCTASSGPHVIGGTAGPSINSSAVVVNNELCNGTLGSITGITATGTGLTYTWSPTGGSALNASNLTQGSYSLLVEDNNGCTANAGPFNVGFTVGPTVDVTLVDVNDETCSLNNGSITGITATGNGLNYSWTNGGGSTLDINNLNQGSYSLTVTDNNNCTANAGPFVVADQTGPTVDATGVVIADEHCGQADGAISGITASGGTGALNYSWTNTAQLTEDIAGLSSNSYTLTVSDQNGCTATSGPHTVNNIAGPIVDISNVVVTDILCDGTLGSISGLTTTPSSGLIFNWLPSGGSNLAASNLVAGTYAITVEDAFGCQTNAGPFTVDPAQDITIDMTGLNVQNSSCTINDGAISGITFSGGTNPTPSWSSGQGTLDINLLAPGTYVLTVSDAFGCSDQVSVDVNTVNGPVIDALTANSLPAHCGQADGGITGIFVTQGTPGYTYEWNGTITTATPDLANVPAGTYQLEVTDAAGCTDSESFVIVDVAGPSIDESGLSILEPTCLNTGEISGLQIIGGVGPYTYSWEGSTLTFLDLVDVFGGTYILTVTDNYGCEAVSSPIVVDEPVGPVASFSFSPSNPNVEDLVTFNNTSTGIGLNYEWTIDILSSSILEDPTYVFMAEGTYLISLEITDQFGCVDSVSQYLTIFDDMTIPNAITADGDGVNDLFVIKGLKPNTQVVILNRWGNIVLHTDNYDNTWGGNDFSGVPCTEGVYTYKVTPANGNPTTGFVHLFR